MSVDYISPAVTDLKRHIAAAAILKEAGRLAGEGSTVPNVTEGNYIQRAIEAYLNILDELRKQGL